MSDHLEPLPEVLKADAELQRLGYGGSDLPRGWAPTVLQLALDLQSIGADLYPPRLRSDYAELRSSIGPEGDARTRSPEACAANAPRRGRGSPANGADARGHQIGKLDGESAVHGVPGSRSGVGAVPRIGLL